MQPAMSTSSRILYDVPCGVCMDNSSGKHYGVFACDGCAGFFKRSVRRDRTYVCKSRKPGSCMIDKIHRNQCRSCRLAKCFEAGMNKDAVQHERGPRNSTVRRQMALFSKDLMPSPEIQMPLNLHSPNMPKPILPPPTMPLTMFPNPFTQFNGFSNMFNVPLITPFGPPLIPMRRHIFHGDIPEKQCEAAARLLFLSVSTTKNFTPFESLSLTDRLLLLVETWAEIFVLEVVQYIYPINLIVTYERGWARISRSCVETFRDVLDEIHRIQPDEKEYYMLRALVLFKTNFNTTRDVNESSAMPAHSGELKRLQDLPAVAELKDRFQVALSVHARTTYPHALSRFSQLNHIVSLVKKVSGRTIIELFFRNTIGDITIEKIISDMYKSGKIPVIPFNV